MGEVSEYAQGRRAGDGRYTDERLRTRGEGWGFGVGVEVAVQCMCMSMCMCTCMCMCMCNVCVYLGCAGSDARERVHADRAEAPREDSGASRLERRRRVDGGFLAIPVEAILILLAIREHNHHPASIRPGCIEVRRLESYALHLRLSETSGRA